MDPKREERRKGKVHEAPPGKARDAAGGRRGLLAAVSPLAFYPDTVCETNDDGCALCAAQVWGPVFPGSKSFVWVDPPPAAGQEADEGAHDDGHRSPR